MEANCETFSDGDFVHVHQGIGTDKPAFWFGDVLVADEPTSLIAHPRRGLVNAAAVNIYRAALTFRGPVCFDCRRRLAARLLKGP